MRITIGKTPQQINTKAPGGAYVQIDGEDFYQISDYSGMRPFFMTIVSDSDHWLYISSSGSLTAGRRNPENALFPYYTDDKIHDSTEITGCKSIFRVEKGGETYLWEPFSERYAGIYAIRRHLYKNVLGNKILFEEYNEDLNLRFRYGWYNSEAFGFVRKAWLENTGSEELQVTLLDGIQNILPAGVDLKLQTERSTLVDAYKKNELLPDTGIGLYLLSSIPVDKAEPSEALKATTVWSTGLERPDILLCSLQLDDFRRGAPIRQEVDVRAERGAYFMNSRIQLAGGAHKKWYLVAELRQGPSEVAALRRMLQEESDMAGQLEADIETGSRQLARIVGSADGLQRTNSREASYRHFSNVLFNLMRGGVFMQQYLFEKGDFLRFMRGANRQLYSQYERFFDSLPAVTSYPEMLAAVANSEQPQLQRLCFEYLPLSFSRRHGDPSRPWNRFSIEIKEEDGSPKLYYQGNWRDIFQNWEALALSYPEFVESMIAKFVNASTVDGYNPYRITRDGIDWEVIEPDDPWSYIGYWGDHQIIYLLKLMELSQRYHPGKLKGFLTQPLFSYADVPYRIRPYEQLLENPFDTVDFDHDSHSQLESREEKTGSDGKLVWDQEGQVYLVNLSEKLLVSLLAKFSNFIAEGGIWMNTQRPEWNDANNALVGRGISMVTLYYIRRFLVFCRQLFDGLRQPTDLSIEVAKLLKAISQALSQHVSLLEGPISDKGRKQLLDALGQAGSHYRQQFYQHGFSGERREASETEIREFLDLALRFTEHSIDANERADGLYHSYNLMKVAGNDEVRILPLYEMLEGQVGVLSSGQLSASKAIGLLQALRKSELFREDQHSYLLYPDRSLPRFVEKNNIPDEGVEKSELIRQLLTNGSQQLVEKDVQGNYHFNPNFHNNNDVKEMLERLKKEGYSELVEKESGMILDLFEQVFGHAYFTGRSGTFYGYEGLGCIYWHMVSKLLLAVQESHQWAVAAGEKPEAVQQLAWHYYDVRQGIGFNKTPEEYGAFPSDPYSHTPGNAGAQQPGMTGQVKEDILSRFGELGVVVEDGKITFTQQLLRQSEFLAEEAVFEFVELQGTAQKIKLPAGTLGFTYCQVPVVYHLSDEGSTVLRMADGQIEDLPGLEIGAEHSREIFGRTGAVSRIDVFLTPALEE